MGFGVPGLARSEHINLNCSTTEASALKLTVGRTRSRESRWVRAGRCVGCVDSGGLVVKHGCVIMRGSRCFKNSARKCQEGSPETIRAWQVSHETTCRCFFTPGSTPPSPPSTKQSTNIARTSHRIEVSVTEEVCVMCVLKPTRIHVHLVISLEAETRPSKPQSKITSPPPSFGLQGN